MGLGPYEIGVKFKQEERTVTIFFFFFVYSARCVLNYLRGWFQLLFLLIGFNTFRGGYIYMCEVLLQSTSYF